MAESKLNKQYIGTSHVERVYKGTGVSSYTYTAPTNGFIYVSTENIGDVNVIWYSINGVEIGNIGDSWSSSGASLDASFPIFMYLNKGDVFSVYNTGSSGMIRGIVFIY